MGPLPVVGAALRQEVVVREVDRAIEREDRRNVERQGLDVLDVEAVRCGTDPGPRSSGGREGGEREVIRPEPGSGPFRAG